MDGELVDQNNENRRLLDEMLEEQSLDSEDPEAVAVIEQFRIEYPKLYSDVERVADHIDHVVDLTGIDHVAIGSDFDGVGDSLPTGLKDVSNYPNLIYELLKRGYNTVLRRGGSDSYCH